MMKELAMATLVAGGVCTAGAGDAALPLTREWDKIFPKSDKVEHCKATFRNRFGITLAADVYKPKMGNGEWGTGSSRRLRSAARLAQSRSSRAASMLRRSRSEAF